MLPVPACFSLGVAARAADSERGESSRPFLAMGVLSHPSNTHRRVAVRATWGMTAVRLSVLLRFVVGRAYSTPARGLPSGDEQRGGAAGPATGSSASASDAQAADMLWLPLDESSSVLQKLLMWVAEAIHRWDPVYIGRADDDAYVRLELVVPDLRLLLARSLTHTAYGSVEWLAVERPSGMVSAWGRGVVQASDSWRWQQANCTRCMRAERQLSVQHVNASAVRRARASLGVVFSTPSSANGSVEAGRKVVAHACGIEAETALSVSYRNVFAPLCRTCVRARSAAKRVRRCLHPLRVSAAALVLLRAARIERESRVPLREATAARGPAGPFPSSRARLRSTPHRSRTGLYARLAPTARRSQSASPHRAVHVLGCDLRCLRHGVSRSPVPWPCWQHRLSAFITYAAKPMTPPRPQSPGSTRRALLTETWNRRHAAALCSASMRRSHQVDGAVQPKPTHWRGSGRVMEDVSVGMLMASRSRITNSTTSDCSGTGSTSSHCDESRRAADSKTGVGDVAIVDIGLALAEKHSLRHSGGFLELRPAHNFSNVYAACLKGVHMGSRMVEHRAAHGRRCRSLQGGCTAKDELWSCMRELHAHSEQGVGPSDGRMKCEACQPMWAKQSRGLVVHHAGWKYCYFQRVAFCTRFPRRPQAQLDRSSVV